MDFASGILRSNKVNKYKIIDKKVLIMTQKQIINNKNL